MPEPKTTNQSTWYNCSCGKTFGTEKEFKDHSCVNHASSKTTRDEYELKCKYCRLGVGACGRKVPFFNEASKHLHEIRCKENPNRKRNKNWGAST